MLKHKQRVSKACAKEETWVHNIQKYWPYYLMVLPGLLFFVIFKFIPMFGSIIAFEDYNIVGEIGRAHV